jgi:hydroxypyruvate reductase
MALRKDLEAIREAALKAVDPAQAVAQHLSLEGELLRVGDRRWDLADREGLYLVAVGKAAVPMAEALVALLGPHLSEGVLVTKYEHAAGTSLPGHLRVEEAGHPLPDGAGQRAAQAVYDLLAALGEKDLVIVLLSGGGSALLPLPVPSLSLSDLQATTEALLRSGATIGELNAVRKHLSQLKGGQLARQAAPAEVLTLVLSDVVGDPLDVIASGPTVPDPTTFEEAWAVLERYDLLESIPSAVREHLQAGVEGEIAETPKQGDALFRRVHNVIVGSNRMASQAAVERAEALGYRALLLTTFVEGEAREVAKVAAALAKGVRLHGDPLEPPACIVWGGETTVTVTGSGKGGRNQELALAAALALAGLPNVALMALATDGTDGPTDAAGAVVSGETVQRMRARDLHPRQALADNDAYPILDAIGALMRTGPTGTNVNDVLVLLVV